MRIFQKLEYTTERLWLDFSRQYSTKGSAFSGHKQAIEDLKDKYLDDDQIEELEEAAAERQRVEEAARQAAGQVGEKDGGADKPQSMWQRVWRVVMENLEIGQH